MTILEKIDRDCDAIENRFYEVFDDEQLKDTTLIRHDQNLEEAVYRLTADFGNDAANEFQTLFATITDSGDAEIYIRVG